jgi:hypothetical protein
VSGPDRTHAILGAAIVLGLLGLAGVIFRLRRDKR